MTGVTQASAREVVTRREPILPGATVGVLGSGQLGRMFAIAARRMGYRVHTFSPDRDTPTGQVADKEVTSAYEDLDALRACERAVMRSYEGLARMLVECASEAFGNAPAVDEDERRAVRPNELEEPRVNRRPDGWPRVADRRRSAGDVVRRRQPCHVFDRYLDRQAERLSCAGIHDGHGPIANRSGCAELGVNLFRIGRRRPFRTPTADC